MEIKDVLRRSLNESWGYLTRATDGLTQEEIAWVPAPDCNSIAFILWHTARVEDVWINSVIRQTSWVYTDQGWREKFGIPAREMGFGYTEEQLKAWPVPKLEDLLGYAGAVHKNTLAFLDSLTAKILHEVPRPERPNETTGAVLSHLITEVALHAGQIDYLRGVLRGIDTSKGSNWTQMASSS